MASLVFSDVGEWCASSQKATGFIAIAVNDEGQVFIEGPTYLPWFDGGDEYSADITAADLRDNILGAAESAAEVEYPPHPEVPENGLVHCNQCGSLCDSPGRTTKYLRPLLPRYLATRLAVCTALLDGESLGEAVVRVLRNAEETVEAGWRPE